MSLWTGSALVQVMACRLFGGKPLSEPMLIYRQLGLWEQTSVKSNVNKNIFIHENAFENVVWENGGHFVQGEMVIKVKRNSRHIAGNVLKCIFLNGIYFSFIIVSVQFVPSTQSAISQHSFGSLLYVIRPPTTIWTNKDRCIMRYHP